MRQLARVLPIGLDERRSFDGAAWRARRAIFLTRRMFRREADRNHCGARRRHRRPPRATVSNRSRPASRHWLFPRSTVNDHVWPERCAKHGLRSFKVSGARRCEGWRWHSTTRYRPLDRMPRPAHRCPRGRATLRKSDCCVAKRLAVLHATHTSARCRGSALDARTARGMSAASNHLHCAAAPSKPLWRKGFRDSIMLRITLRQPWSCGYFLSSPIFVIG